MGKRNCNVPVCRLSPLAQNLCTIPVSILIRYKVVSMEIKAKLQNTPNLICILLNNNSIYCYIPRSSKHTDTCYGWAGVFCNRSEIKVISIHM